MVELASFVPFLALGSLLLGVLFVAPLLQPPVEEWRSDAQRLVELERARVLSRM